jgi:hypothetical protein
MNDTQEYILQKSIDNLIKMVDKLNKDLETVSKESDHYHSMYIKYKQMYQDLLFHETGAKDSKPRDPTGLQNLLIYEAGVEDGKVSARQEDKSQSTIIASSDTEEESKEKVKVNKTDEFCKLMDDIYPLK